MITEHFSLIEFGCKDKTAYPPEWITDRLKPLCEQMEIIRKACGDKRIRVVSGYRTPAWNKRVGGVAKSQHTEGRAVDFKVDGLEARKVTKIVLELIKEGKIRDGGVGDYASFTHYDIGKAGRRWVK